MKKTIFLISVKRRVFFFFAYYLFFSISMHVTSFSTYYAHASVPFSCVVCLFISCSFYIRSTFIHSPSSLCSATCICMLFFLPSWEPHAVHLSQREYASCVCFAQDRLTNTNQYIYVIKWGEFNHEDIMEDFHIIPCLIDLLHCCTITCYFTILRQKTQDGICDVKLLLILFMFIFSLLCISDMMAV